MSNNNKIAKNTFVLYVRQIFILIVTLYSVRIVLNTLGVIDYGIFNVIAGIVSFFAFLSGTMASASQRFFSFALGKNDNEAIKKIFSINILIYFLVAISAFILLETLGLWFFEKKLLLPIYRKYRLCLYYS